MVGGHIGRPDRLQTVDRGRLSLGTGGFASLVFAHWLPVALIASAATGFAEALFNPAVRAYIAADSGERRVEAFAVFNIFYQAGILLGQLVRVLIATDFLIAAADAAAISRY